MQSDIPHLSEWRENRPRESGQRDYRAFDQILTMVQVAFVSIHHTYANEERRRWDAPVITLMWSDDQGINRNLNGFVLGTLNPTGLEVEANAWMDVTTDGTTLLRRWQHFPIGGKDSREITKGTVEKLVKEAYQAVSSCSREDLREPTPLPHGIRNSV